MPITQLLCQKTEWLGRKVLAQFSAETAHALSLRLLQRKWIGYIINKAYPIAPRPHASLSVGGIQVSNPIGLAAGFDKNGLLLNRVADLGFGFAEFGTVTPLAQSGNAKPRLFRVQPHCALINRLGFNNHGIDAMVAKLRKRNQTIPIGINIGKNRQTLLNEAARDYHLCFEKILNYADYATVNVSSPNTPGLCDLQESDRLFSLLDHLNETKLQVGVADFPIWLKLSPDLSIPTLINLATRLAKSGLVQAVVLSNTTQKRPHLPRSAISKQKGGLSGPPCFAMNLEIVRAVAHEVEKKLDIVAVGGINCMQAAEAYLQAGAKAIQLYTGYVYEGHRLISELHWL